MRFLLLMCAACGTASARSADAGVEAAVMPSGGLDAGGLPITAADIVGWNDIIGSQGGSTRTVAVATLNRPGLCALDRAQTPTRVPNMELFTVGVGTSAFNSPSPPPIGPGTYAIGAGAFAEITTTDAACAIKMSTAATSGTVTIKTVTATEVAIDFDVMMGGSEVVGTFDTPVCEQFDPKYLSVSVAPCN